MRKWICTKNKKPRDLEEVIVTFVNHCPESYYSNIKDKPFTGACVYYKGEWFWYSSITRDILAEYGGFDSEKVDPDIEITHWMPLPNPPAELEKRLRG